MRDRKRAERAAVKGILKREYASLLSAAVVLRFCVRVGARELERAIHSLGAAIGEKDPIQAGPFNQLARQRRLIRIMKKIRNVNGAARLTPNYAHQSRMRVAQRVDGDASQKIQIFPSLGVVEPAAAPMREHNRRTSVRIHQVARFGATNLRGRERLFLCSWLALVHFQQTTPSTAFAVV